MNWQKRLWSRVRALKMATRKISRLRLFSNIYGGLTTRGAAALAIAFTVAAIVIPIGIGEIYAANTTGWNAAVTTIFTVLFPILFVVGVSLKVFAD